MTNNLALYGNQPIGDVMNLPEWKALRMNEALEQKFKKKKGK